MNKSDKELDAVNKQISGIEKEITEKGRPEGAREISRETLIELRDKRNLIVRKIK